MYIIRNITMLLNTILHSLQEGVTRHVCPSCEGGSKNEKSLVCTKEGRRIRWFCHRASCGYRGSSVLSGGKLWAETTSESDDSLFNDSLLSGNTYTLNTAGRERREVRDHKGAVRGAVYRKPKGSNIVGPKDLNDIDKNWCKLHFPSPLTSDSLILVEDIPSAEKMDKHYPTVSLLGVNLNEAKLNLLLDNGVKRVIIALDNDATRFALRIAKKYMIETTVLPLERDLKDETNERLIKIAQDIR